LMLGTSGKILSDSHFIFFNNLKSPDGSVEHTGDNLTGEGEGDDEVIKVNIAGLPADVDKVAFIASIYDAETRRQAFGQVRNAYIRVVNQADNNELARYDLSEDYSTETALVFGELYRNGAEWKFRAVGQGYASGLAGLATDFGIAVDEPAPAAAPPPADPVSLTKQRKLVDMEKRVATQAPQLVSLVKTAKVSLEKKGLGEHTARVALCLDISGSMLRLYRSGRVQKLVERVLALALRFDDDGQVDVWLFGREAHDAGAVTLANFSSYADSVLRRYGLEGGTHYGKVMQKVRSHYFGSAGPRTTPRPGELPVYVIFVTDGATSDEKTARTQVTASSYEPLFWQFLAIGRSSRSVDPAKAPTGATRRGRRPALAAWGGGEFRFLEELDDMPGRLLDNADFFAVEDPAAIPDDVLFDLLMTEYPGWLTAARAAGLVPAQ